MPSTFVEQDCQPGVMIPIDPLLKRLAGLPGMEAGNKRLVVVLGQLGDFDSMECAQLVTG